MATRGAPKPKPKPKPRQEKSKWEFKASDCIEFYSIQPRTFYQRMSSDMCPENIKIKTGFYNLKLMNDYFVSHFFDEEEGETTLLQEKVRNEKAKADLNEIKVKEKDGDLLPIEKIVSGLSLTLSNLKHRLWGWIKSLPPLTQGLDEKELRIIYEKEIRLILTDLATNIQNLTPKKKKVKKKKKAEKIINIEF